MRVRLMPKRAPLLQCRCRSHRGGLRPLFGDGCALLRDLWQRLTRQRMTTVAAALTATASAGGCRVMTSTPRACALTSTAYDSCIQPGRTGEPRSPRRCWCSSLSLRVRVPS